MHVYSLIVPYMYDTAAKIVMHKLKVYKLLTEFPVFHLHGNRYQGNCTQIIKSTLQLDWPY